MKHTLLTICLMLFALPSWGGKTISGGKISTGEDGNIESKVKNEIKDDIICKDKYVFSSEDDYVVNNAKDKLLSIGYNKPVCNPKQEYISGLDVPENMKNFYLDVQSNLNSTLGGYFNYVHIIYNKNGTENDVKPVANRLNELNYRGINNHTLEDIINGQSCLSGADPGGGRTKNTNPHSICIEDYDFTKNPWGGKDSQNNINVKLALHYAHEYFHHYQRVHSLDRGLDYQHGEGSVDAPWWWIEGAAVSFQNAWFRENWYNLNAFKDKKWSDVKGVSIASVTSDDVYKRFRRSIMNSSFGKKDPHCPPDWKLNEKEERYSTASKCSASMMAVPFIAYKSSYKTVWIDIPQDYYHLGFWGAIKKHLGMTKTEFYDAFNEFIRSGKVGDKPPKGWKPRENEIYLYAKFLDIIPAS